MEIFKNTINPIKQEITRYAHRVRAGFPSPADDYQEAALDLNEYLVRHPSATYFVRAEGDSMKGCGINNGDLLVVDRSLTFCHGDIVIASIGGELTCKTLNVRDRELSSANPDYPPIPIPEDMELVIEGVVIFSVTQHRCSL